MSFESLSTIFSNKQDLAWQDEDVRFFIEGYLGDLVRQGGVVCRVRGEQVSIRVSGPLIYQEVSLWVSDVKRAVKNECDLDIKQVVIEF